MSDEHWWGMSLPEGATKAYGARAIYTPHRKRLLDFPPDRISWRDKIAKRDLAVVLNEIRRKLRDRAIDVGDAQIVSGRAALRPDYVYTFSPRSSHGYLYISIWYDPKETR
jgi:hypothetical protein